MRIECLQTWNHWKPGQSEPDVVNPGRIIDRPEAYAKAIIRKGWGREA
jgi:hypothetical protein